MKGKSQDFFKGEILQNGKVVSKIFGNYMGFLDFDGERYWDVREQLLMPVHDGHGFRKLPSDSRNRTDLTELKRGDVDRAQEQKEELEEL